MSGLPAVPAPVARILASRTHRRSLDAELNSDVDIVIDRDLDVINSDLTLGDLGLTGRLARADELQAEALLDYLERRDAHTAGDERVLRPAPRWLRAVEAVQSSARHPVTVIVDGLVLVGVGIAAHLALVPLLVAALVILVTAYVSGIYGDRDTVQTQGALWYPGRLVLPFGLLGFAAMASGALSKHAVLRYAPLAIGGLALVRGLTWAVLFVQRRRGVGLRRTLVIGAGEPAATVVRRLGEFPEAGLAPVGTRPLSLLLTMDAMFEEIGAAKVEHVVLVLDPIDEISVVDSLRRAHGVDTFFSMVPPLADLFLRPGKVGEVGGIPLVPLGRVLRGRTAFPGKRVLDIVLSSVALVLLAPLMLATAIAIKLDDRGPVFFRQRRVGRDGETFPMLKFRSMVIGAERMRDVLEQANVTDGLLFKLDDDPRITRVGRFIRKASFDELPQFWNVLRGDMSLVGPRPLPVEPESFGPLDAQRHAVRPGITGYWQVSGGNGLTYREMIKLDLAYLHNWSMWLDIRLLMRTVPALFNRHGPI
jgi:exopolysaccharide biosynthesis polyprenyl glycosylphosphotransferase